MSSTKNILLLVNTLVFILLFFSLSYYNRPAHDDFYSIYTVNENGVIGSVIYQYKYWCTRYIATFISFSVTAIPDILVRNMLMSSLLFLIFTWSFYRILQLLPALQHKSKLHLLQLSIFILSGLFYSSLNIGETWFWLSANSAFTLGLGITLLGISFVFSNTSTIFQLLVVYLLFFLVGGMHEMLAIFLIILGFLVLFLAKKLNIQPTQFQQILVAQIALFISVSLLILGPGNSHREAFFEDIGVFHSLFLNIKMTGIIGIKHLLFTLPIMIVWSFTFTQLVSFKINLQLNLKTVLTVLGAFAALVYIYQLPVTYKTQDIAALRTLLPITCIALISLVLITQLLNKTWNNKKILTVPFLLAILTVQLFLIRQQYHILPSYSKALDERIQIIENIECKSNIIKVPPLPSSGWIKSAELSSNPKNNINKHFMNGLGINCEIKVLRTE